MLTDKTAMAKRKLNLSQQTVSVLSDIETGDAQLAAPSTNQTQQASCGGTPRPVKQQPQTPVAPVKRP
jgi:hypothetical protein